MEKIYDQKADVVGVTIRSKTSENAYESPAIYDNIKMMTHIYKKGSSEGLNRIFLRNSVWKELRDTFCVKDLLWI